MRCAGRKSMLGHVCHIVWPAQHLHESFLELLWLEGMTDALGRSLCATVPPKTCALPSAAYRRLLEFLSCEPTFCNLVIPRFLPYGWVVLCVKSDAAEPPKGQCATSLTPVAARNKASGEPLVIKKETKLYAGRFTSYMRCLKTFFCRCCAFRARVWKRLSRKFVAFLRKG